MSGTDSRDTAILLLKAAGVGSCVLAAFFGSGCGASTRETGEPRDGSNATVTPADTDAGCTPGTGLQNGDFSQGLRCWSAVVVSGGGNASVVSTTYYAPTKADCDPAQEGNPFVLLNAYRSDVYISQTLTVPDSAKTLSCLEWNNLDPTTATVSIVVSGTEDILDSSEPPSLQALSDPSNLYSVICSSKKPASISKDITKYAGKQVELRLRGTYVSGVNGTFMSYDNVVVQ